MYAIGHLGIGYLATKTLFRDQDLNVALILTLSLIPDIDLLIPLLPHRGPTHSILVLVALSAFLFLYNKKYAPYSVSYATHIAADGFTGTCPQSTQLFWPISMDWFSFYPRLSPGTTLEALSEVALIIGALAVLWYSKDHQRLLEPRLLNLSLFIPTVAVFVSLIGGYYGGFIPDLLLLPHLIVFLAFIVILAKNLLGIEWRMHVR